MKLTHTLFIILFIILLIFVKFVKLDEHLFISLITMVFGYCFSILMSIIGISHAKYQSSFEQIPVKNLKAKHFDTNYSLQTFLQICSKDLYDEFFKDCFDNKCYSDDSYQLHFQNNSQHFNYLLKNELKSKPF